MESILKAIGNAVLMLLGVAAIVFVAAWVWHKF